jgi:hypothetical protein
MRLNVARLLFVASACFLMATSSEAQRARPVGAWRPVANPLAGYHALGPVLLSVTAVAGFGTGNLNEPEPRTTFVLAALEPGIFAGRASLIFAHWLSFEGGGILRATYLRFWDSPTREYFGGEAQWVISVLPIGLRVGAFKPTAATDGSRKVLWLADLSVMY